MLYVYKCMPNKLHNGWRAWVIFLLFTGMLLSLFISRAALSITMALFVLVSCIHREYRQQWRNFLSSRVCTGMSLLFLLPLVSGGWSDDRNTWLQLVQVKLPLILLPLAFASPFTLKPRMWEGLVYLLVLLVVAGSLWSVGHYAADPSAAEQDYLQAKTLLTPLKNDHVRFSWLVSATVLLAGWLAFQKRQEQKVPAFLLGLAAVWLAVYLHILAVRTGLFSLYGMMIACTIWLGFRKPGYGISVLAALIVLPLLAWLLLPTFRNRVKYIRYDYAWFSKGAYLQGGNDALRVISLKAGWHLLEKHPWQGTGFGDIKKDADAWYAAEYPEMKEEEKVYPASEWLVYGAGCGWPGVLLFSVAMLLPFFARVTNKGAWWLLNATAAFSFLFDTGLEVQYGVFLYAILVLWCWKWWRC